MRVNVNQLRQDRATAKAGLEKILGEHLSAAQAANRGFTPEEKAAQEQGEAEVKRLDELIVAEERRLELGRAAAGTSPSIQVGAPNSDADPRRGFASHRQFFTAVLANAGLRDRGQVEDERLKPLAIYDKEDKAASGELAFMLPVAFTPPSVRATVSSDEQGEYDDRYGGFAVPKSRAAGLLEVGFEGDPTAGRTQPVPMGTPSVEIMARVDKNHTSSVVGGFTVGRRAETVAATASRAQLEMITLKASSLFGLAYATEELLADSPQSFVAIIENGFRTQFGAHMLNEKLRGTGGDQFLGILTALAANTAGPTISVAKESGQAADTIVAANVLKMRARCWGYGQAVWLTNHDTFPQLATMSIGVGTAGVLMYSPNSDRPESLLGRPILFTEYASKLGDQGDLILANFSQFLEGVYQPLQSAESVHVRFSNHERAFKLWLRNAGAPWWRSALTPNKSSDTLSPFVTLDAR